MNKIYKVVWSKVKNCYVVVSEIAKNVITGAVKSAKVGSSVAMGAAMAFVITGNAMAAAGTIELGSIYPTEQIDEKYSASDKLIVEYSVYDQYNSKIVLESGGDTSIGSIYAKSKSDITVDSVGNTTIGSVNSSGYGGQININSGETTTTGGITISNSNGGGDTINVGGKNISIDAGTGYGVSVRGGYYGFSKETTANIGTVETENVDIKGSYGLISQYEHSDINVYGKELNIEATERGIYTGNNSDCYTPSAEVNVYSDHTKITMAEGKNALVAFSDSTLNIHGGLEVTAKDAILVRGQSTVNVNAAGEGVVKLDGNVNFNNQYGTGVHVGANNNVNINMTTADSYLNGKIYVSNSSIDYENGGKEQTYEDVSGMKLGMSNGATWNVTGDSFVNNLYGTDGKLTGKDVEVIVYNREDKAGVAVTNDKLTIDGVDLVIDTAKTAIYNQDLTIESNADVTIKSQQQGISAYGDVVIKAENVTIESVDNGIQSVADANPNDVGNVTIKATEDVTITAGDEGYAVTNVSKNGGVIDIEGKDVTLVSENRTAVKVGHEKGQTGYNGTVNVTGETITIEGAAKEAKEGQYRQSAAVLAQGSETELNLTATDAITIKNTGDTNKGSAIAAFDGAAIEVTAGGDVEVTGQVNAWQQTVVDIAGKNVTLANNGADTVRGVGATINIAADENINITTVEKDGIQACASDINLTANKVVIDADAWGINVTGDAGSDVVINAADIEITGYGAADGDMGGIRNLGDSEVILNATNSIKVTGDIKAAGSGEIEVTADEGGVAVAGNVDVTGAGSSVAIEADGGNVSVAGQVNAWQKTVVDIAGANVTLANDGADTVRGVGATINIAADENINITTVEKDGIQACASDITLTAQNVVIDADAWGINVTGDAGSNVAVYAENIKITGDGAADGDMGGIRNLGASEVILNANNSIEVIGDIYAAGKGVITLANGGSAVFSRGGAVVNNGSTVVDGDIHAKDESVVNVGFRGEESALKGNVFTDADATTNLAFAEGATWYADGSEASNVTNLDVDGANIVIDNAQAGAITVDALTGTGMHVEFAAGEDAEEGTIVVGEEKEDVRVSVTTNGINVSASTANKYYKNIVETVAGEGLVDEVNAKDTYITGDVRFEADANGELKVVDTTLNGDVNVTGKLTAENGLKVNTSGEGSFSIGNIGGNTLFYGMSTDAGKTNPTIVMNAQNGNIETQGSLSVGNGAFVSDAASGNAAVQGSLAVGGNAAVAGGLEVGTDVVAKGDVVAGDVSLKETAAKVENNDKAIQENRNDIEANREAIKDVQEVANKNAADIAVNKEAIKDLQDATNKNTADIAVNKADIEANKQAIADEVAAREAADKALSDAIENVAGDIVDTKAQVEDNKAAIADNAQAIENEVADRVAADNKLQANLDKESVDRQIADAQERAERAQADQELQNAIDAEEEAREAAVKAEEDARKAADAELKREMDSAVSDLNNRIDKVDAKIDKVGAMAAAMASLKTMGYDPEAPTEIAVGIGQYRNETGIAIGAFHYPNKNFMLNFSLSTAGDEVMGGIGATWKIGRKR